MLKTDIGGEDRRHVSKKTGSDNDDSPGRRSNIAIEPGGRLTVGYNPKTN